MPRSYISLRAGSTLSLNCQKKDSTGTPESLALVTVSATLNESATNKVLATMLVTVTNEALGQFTLSATAATTALIGQAGANITIKYVYDSGVVDILDPFPVEIRK